MHVFVRGSRRPHEVRGSAPVLVGLEGRQLPGPQADAGAGLLPRHVAGAAGMSGVGDEVLRKGGL